VDELDQLHSELKTMGDKSLPLANRQKAHQGCLASNARLVNLILEAGGTQKLAYVAWDDRALNRLNMDIISARNAYLMYCYYGVGGTKTFDVEKEDGSHVDARREIAGLR
jgi:hypothetical protein